MDAANGAEESYPSAVWRSLFRLADFPRVINSLVTRQHGGNSSSEHRYNCLGRCDSDRNDPMLSVMSVAETSSFGIAYRTNRFR